MLSFALSNSLTSEQMLMSLHVIYVVELCTASKRTDEGQYKRHLSDYREV